MCHNSNNTMKQQGTALIVVLIFLTTVTLLGLTSIQNSILDTKINANHQHSQVSKQAAENALAKLTAPDPEPSDKGETLLIPQLIINASTNNQDYYNTSEAILQPASSADLGLSLLEQSQAGKYRISGFSLNVRALIYQADARGKVQGSHAISHHRMQVARIRE